MARTNELAFEGEAEIVGRETIDVRVVADELAEFGIILDPDPLRLSTLVLYLDRGVENWLRGLRLSQDDGVLADAELDSYVSNPASAVSVRLHTCNMV